jgi:hypothetical protein
MYNHRGLIINAARSRGIGCGICLALLLAVVFLSAAGTASAQDAPGYSNTVLRDSMDGNNRWRTWAQPDYSVQFDSGRLRMQFQAANHYAWSFAEQIGPLRDLVIQTDVQVERPSIYTEYGLVFRAVQQIDGLTSYVVMFNNEGKFRFGLSKPTGFQVIQDWRPSGIQDATKAARVGVFAKGNQFMVLVAGKAVATVEDSTLAEAGQVGLLIGTGPGIPSTVSLLYDNVAIDAPNTEPIVVLPPKILNSARAPSLIFEELQEARVLPLTLRQVFISQQSYVNNYREGFVALRLSKQATYKDWIALADISWSSPRSGIACGLATRYVSDNLMDFVYIDKRGAYGMAQVIDGAARSMRYEQSPLVNLQESQSNRLIVIGQGTWTALYINGELAATMYGTPRSGLVTSAAYNYELASVRCQFDNFVVYAIGE